MLSVFHPIVTELPKLREPRPTLPRYVPSPTTTQGFCFCNFCFCICSLVSLSLLEHSHQNINMLKYLSPTILKQFPELHSAPIVTAPFFCSSLLSCSSCDKRFTIPLYECLLSPQQSLCHTVADLYSFPMSVTLYVTHTWL